jgi:hypothetical protein
MNEDIKSIFLKSIGFFGGIIVAFIISIILFLAFKHFFPDTSIYHTGCGIK